MPATCAQCGGKINQTYMPMAGWGVRGPLCGACYSKRIAEHYPGEHVRINSD